jgi:peptidoglycan/xylan/chitin deacetylase (PgdA/CDA1 family)
VSAARLLARAAAGAVAAWGVYAWGAHLATPGVVRRGPRGSRRVALTFDDGPDPEWTPRVLALLAERGVRGSFFLVGARAARAPHVVRRIVADGHEVGNHGWAHRSLWLCGPRRTGVEIGRCQAVLTDLTGRAPALFRPPWGMVNAATLPALRRHGLTCVFWTVQPEGLRPASPALQARRTLGRARPGAILDLHDAEGLPGAPRRLCEALPAMIDGLRRAGYEFATVGELLRTGPGAPAR